MTYGGNADTDEEWWALVAGHSRRVDEALEAAGREAERLRRATSTSTPRRPSR